MKDKIALIIQGPLITYGQGPNNSITGFKTFESITKNYENAKNYGINPTICTWADKTEQERVLSEKLKSKGYKIIQLLPPETEDHDHRFKHHYAIQKSIECVNAEYIIKIRTDMIMPLDFWTYIKENIDEKLTVSDIIQPYYLGDFIYASSKETMVKYLSSIVKHNSNNIHPSITTDLGLKYFINENNKKITKLNIILLYLINKDKSIKEWGDFAQKNIKVLPLQIFKDIIWREKKIGDFLNLEAFTYTTETQLKNNNLELKFLISEYARYFEKRNSKKKYIAKALLKILKIKEKVKRQILKKEARNK